MTSFMANEIFVDTSAFYAFLIKGDDRHRSAVRHLREARRRKRRFVTTDHVLDETATLFATQPVNRGAVIDVGAGYRVWRDLYAGVVVSSFKTQADATYSASVPE